MRTVQVSTVCCALAFAMVVGCSADQGTQSSGGTSDVLGVPDGVDPGGTADDASEGLGGDVASVERAPIFITTMTHLEGAWNYEGPDGQEKFDHDVGKIDLAMDTFDAHGALLTIESETPFAHAAAQWGSDVFERLMARGHGVGSHCDIPPDQAVLPVDEFAEQFVERKTPMDTLVGAENNLGCSGGQGRNDWIAGAHLAGFKYIDGIVGFAYLSMPLDERPEGWTDGYILIDGHFHDNVPVDLETRIHPFMMDDATDMEPDVPGKVLLLAGGLGRLDSFAEAAAGESCNPNCTFEDADIDGAFARIDEALALHDDSRVGKLEVYFPLSFFVTSQLPYIESFLSRLKSDYIDTGKLVWGTQADVYHAYMAWNGLE